MRHIIYLREIESGKAIWVISWRSLYADVEYALLKTSSFYDFPIQGTQREISSFFSRKPPWCSRRLDRCPLEYKESKRVQRCGRISSKTRLYFSGGSCWSKRWKSSWVRKKIDSCLKYVLQPSPPGASPLQGDGRGEKKISFNKIGKISLPAWTQNVPVCVHRTGRCFIEKPFPCLFLNSCLGTQWQRNGVSRPFTTTNRSLWASSWMMFIKKTKLLHLFKLF